MQLKSSTDYAIRIVCYLATHNGMVSTSELSKQLCITSTYIPKIAKKLKDANIIVALEGKGFFQHRSFPSQSDSTGKEAKLDSPL